MRADGPRTFESTVLKSRGPIFKVFSGFWAGGLEGFRILAGLTQKTASATSYAHWASEGLCIGSMSFL